jgi:mRNA-degrading endonuclease RelE of RelBE toxin-antitoxin system
VRKLALQIKITATPLKYLNSLDKPTRQRIIEKLKDIAEHPTDARLSYPLTASDKRSSRVGGYRILFQIEGQTLEVADIGPRGQIYRKA